MGLCDYRWTVAYVEHRCVVPDTHVDRKLPHRCHCGDVLTIETSTDDLGQEEF